jgi:hypothetical protein
MRDGEDWKWNNSLHFLILMKNVKRVQKEAHTTKEKMMVSTMKLKLNAKYNQLHRRTQMRDSEDWRWNNP